MKYGISRFENDGVCLLDPHRRTIATTRGQAIYDAENTLVGTVRGDEIFDSNDKLIAKVHGSDIRDARGVKVGSTEDVLKSIAGSSPEGLYLALWYFFVR